MVGSGGSVAEREVDAGDASSSIGPATGAGGAVALDTREAGAETSTSPVPELDAAEVPDAMVGAGGALAIGGSPGTGGAAASNLDGAFAVDLALDSSAGPDSTANRSAWLVVGAGTLGSGDSNVRTRLLGKGFDVTVIADADLASSGSVTAAVVIISSTASSSLVGTTFLSTPVPIMTWESQLFASMGLVDGTASSSSGETATGATALVVNPSAGPLAAGLSGTVTVLSSSLAQINWGVPGAQAIAVAAVSGEASHLAIFAYDQGAQMVGLLAPARRVAFFLTRSSSGALTAEGWKLFDAAVAWLVGS